MHVLNPSYLPYFWAPCPPLLQSAASTLIPSLGRVSQALIGALPMSTLLVSNESLVAWEQQEVPLAAAGLVGGA